MAIATGVLFDQIIVALACNDEQHKGVRSCYLTFPLHYSRVSRIVIIKGNYSA